MGAPARAIGEGHPAAERGVGDEIIGIVIGVGPVLRRAAEIVGRDEPVQRIIAIGPGAGGIRRGDAGDAPPGVTRIGEVQQPPVTEVCADELSLAADQP